MVIAAQTAPKFFIRGELHTATPATPAALTLYKEGSLSAYTLAADERLVIASYILVVSAAGDAFIFVGADSTAGAGEYVTRGTFAANGGVSTATINYVGGKGHLVYATGPAGVLDAIVYGWVV